MYIEYKAMIIRCFYCRNINVTASTISSKLHECCSVKLRMEEYLISKPMSHRILPNQISATEAGHQLMHLVEQPWPSSSSPMARNRGRHPGKKLCRETSCTCHSSQSVLRAHRLGFRTLMYCRKCKSQLTSCNEKSVSEHFNSILIQMHITAMFNLKDSFCYWLSAEIQ